MPSILGNDSEADEDSECDDFLLFPLTEVDGNCNDADKSSSDDDIDGIARQREAFANRKRSTFGMGQFQPAMTLKGRRRSLLIGCSESGLLANRGLHETNTAPNLQYVSGVRPIVQCDMSPRNRWKLALRLIRTLKVG